MDLNTLEPVAPKTRFATISLHDASKIWLLKFTASEIRAIKSIIEASWPKRIETSRFLFDTSHEIKLTGRPWWCLDSDEESTPARILVRNLLAYLFSKGWILSLPTCMSSGREDHGVMLIFREHPMPPPQSEWLALLFARNNWLRVIGAPTDLIAGIRAVVRGRGLSVDERWQNRNQKSYEFQLRGLGGVHAESEGVTSKVVVVMLLETLEKFGWSVYASLQHKYKMPETWYCVKRLDWVSGNAVFHR